MRNLSNNTNIHAIPRCRFDYTRTSYGLIDVKQFSEFWHELIRIDQHTPTQTHSHKHKHKHIQMPAALQHFINDCRNYLFIMLYKLLFYKLKSILSCRFRKFVHAWQQTNFQYELFPTVFPLFPFTRITMRLTCARVCQYKICYNHRPKPKHNREREREKKTRNSVFHLNFYYRLNVLAVHQCKMDYYHSFRNSCVLCSISF